VEAKTGNFRLIKAYLLQILLKTNGKTGHRKQQTGKETVFTAVKILQQGRRNTRNLCWNISCLF